MAWKLKKKQALLFWRHSEAGGWTKVLAAKKEALGFMHTLVVHSQKDSITIYKHFGEVYSLPLQCLVKTDLDLATIWVITV